MAKDRGLRIQTENGSAAIAIKVEHASKTFRLPHNRQNSLKGSLINLAKGGERSYEKQEVLKDISFEIKKGEFFGIVGRNGSGKSTLLKMLAGIYKPTEGKITVNGSLTPFIELGVGFNPELTGRENVFLNGALLGFSREDMNAMYDDIVDFAELERFMDQKLKNYSSGMQVRLAFSIAIRAQSNILLLDEVLAVGDAAFQQKCFDYFYEIKKKGTTVIFVSHDRSSLERFCDRGILIHDGALIDSGKIVKIMKSYSNIILQELEKTVTTDEVAVDSMKAHDRIASIEKTESLDASLKAQKNFVYGEDIIIRFETKILMDVSNPILGVTIRQRHVDKPIFAANTLIDGKTETGNYKKGDTLSFSVTLPPLLNDGEYTVEPAVANDSATIYYDQKPKAATFMINGSSNPYSIISGSEPIVLESKK